MDFGALPPEINSGLIYSGPGPGGLIGAAQAWNTLSQELSSTATAYGSVITSLATTWLGPSATAMQTAARPYLAWLEATSELAGQSAVQANAAAAAFSAAFTATVPPPVIAANRTQLTTLIVTNLLGQNTPAIAANEAAYAEMWAQDAAAMNTYATTSSTATAGLPTFQPAPQTANPAAQAAPTAAVPAQTIFDDLFGNGTTIGQLTQALISSSFPFDVVQIFSNFIGYTMIAQATEAAHNIYVPPAQLLPMTPYTPPPAPTPEPVKAATGVGQPLGRITVPPSWAQPQPTPEPGRWPPRPINANVTGPKAAIPAVPFMPVTGLRSNQAKARIEPEYGHVSKVLPPRNPAGG